MRLLSLGVLAGIVGICCAASVVRPAAAMDLTTHSTAGAALGLKLGRNALQAFMIGMASHAVLDILPHRASRLDTRDAIAYTAGGAVALYDRWRGSGWDSRVVWGAVGGVFPDVEHLLHGRKKVFPTHSGALPHGQTKRRDVDVVLKWAINGLALRAMW
ncbi:MAG: hypothetical protein ACUVTZ_05140 [Armatimonadota bacterium]